MIPINVCFSEIACNCLIEKDITHLVHEMNLNGNFSIGLHAQAALVSLKAAGDDICEEGMDDGPWIREE